MNNIKGGLALMISAYLQQHSLLFQSNYSKLYSLMSLGLEIFSIYELPLSTYILLGSLHIVAHNQIKNYYFKTPPTIKQTIGNIFIIVGCIIALVFCGFQEKILKFSEIQETFKFFYYLWMIFNLVLNVFMRTIGFYAGKIVFELSIPAQIASFGFSSLKILCLMVDFYWESNEFDFFIFGCFLIVVVIALVCSNSFIDYFRQKHSESIVFTFYYLWLLCYCFPLGITLVNAGVFYTFSHYFGLFLALGLIGYGTYLHSYISTVPQYDEEEDKLIEI